MTSASTDASRTSRVTSYVCRSRVKRRSKSEGLILIFVGCCSADFLRGGGVFHGPCWRL